MSRAGLAVIAVLLLAAPAPGSTAYQRDCGSYDKGRIKARNVRCDLARNTIIKFDSEVRVVTYYYKINGFTCSLYDNPDNVEVYCSRNSGRKYLYNTVPRR